MTKKGLEICSLEKFEARLFNKCLDAMYLLMEDKDRAVKFWNCVVDIREEYVKNLEGLQE